MYYLLFHDHGLLDSTNAVHLVYSLHYCYIPRINHSLKKFTLACKSLRSERNKSSNQLWILGLNQYGMPDDAEDIGGN